MYLDDLNTNQLKAVKLVNSPVRIIAGPGSGKTKTIISKIAYILEQKLASPEEILVYTFTNKSALEIKERVKDFIDIGVKNIFTYHAWAAYFLRKEAGRLGISSDYRIIDNYDRTKLVKEIIKENDLDAVDYREAMSKFSTYSFNEKKLKNDIKLKGYYNEIARLYELYINKKNESNLYDFDDLLIKVKNFLCINNEVKNLYKDKYKYIFVDEFQDINEIQYDILKSLTNENSFITVVGDPDQNIYSWRGSKIEIILNFENDYKNVETIILSKNYRSTKSIIKIANALIKKNNNRITFDVKAVKKDDNFVNLIVANSEFDESFKVIEEILKLNKLENISFHNMAIIYRNNYISRTFESELLKRDIPYHMIGGFKFYERKEVKEVLYFLRFLYKYDDFSFLNIINVPARGMGPRAIENLKEYAKQKTQSLWEIAKNTELKIPNKLKEFVKIAQNYEDKFTKKNGINILKDFLREIGFIEFYKENENKIGNINGLLEQLSVMIKQFPTLDELFNMISISSSADLSSKKDHLTLITSHASKGLEFKVVFFVGVNQGVIPSYKAQTISEIEEERRVAYVTITRAMDRLYISYSLGMNFIYHKQNSPSIFIKDIQNELNNYNYKEENKIELDNNSSSLDNKNLSAGDIIYHRTFRKGVVLKVEKKFFIAFFEEGFGQKELILGHPSYFKKK